MSQAKVDRYKEQKKNRKKIMAKEKREWFLTQAFLVILGLVIIVWVAIAGYQAVTTPTADTDTAVESTTYTIDSSALEDYLSSIEEA